METQENKISLSDFLKKKNYHPKFDNFPIMIVSHLYLHGESRNKDIRAAIGLDEYCAHSDYADRSNYYFDVICDRLINKGIIERTKRGYYKLTSM